MRATRRIAQDREAILRVAGSVAAGMSSAAREIDPRKPVGYAAELRTKIASIAVDIAIAIVRDVDSRIDAEGPPEYVKPPRTGYVDEQGVYHAGPIPMPLPGDGAGER